MKIWTLYFKRQEFKDFANNFDSPEEMLENISVPDEESKRRCYLICFELWRRLLLEKRSISIFCDEFDRVVSAYENKRDDEKLKASLSSVLEILERNLSSDDSAEEIFSRLSSYIAHDLENIIYTFIDTKIKDGEIGEFIDLLDHFYALCKGKARLQIFKA